MKTKEKAIQLLFRAVDEVNRMMPKQKRLKKSEDTVLFGRSAALDSLGLVNLIVAAEEKIKEECAVALSLADERSISAEDSPFRTIGTFAEYIALLLEENTGEYKRV